MTRRREYRPVRLEVDEGDYRGLYEIHLGRPGKPRVYRIIGKHGLRRVKDPLALDAVSSAYGKRLAVMRKLAKVQKEAKVSRVYRWRLAIGALLARFWARIKGLFKKKP